MNTDVLFTAACIGLAILGGLAVGEQKDKTPPEGIYSIVCGVTVIIVAAVLLTFLLFE